MKMTALIVALAACGSTDVHTVVDCPGGQCEYGCRNGQPATDAGSCVYRDETDFEHICGTTFYTDGADPGHQGCCVKKNDLTRFYECCGGECPP